MFTHSAVHMINVICNCLLKKDKRTIFGKSYQFPGKAPGKHNIRDVVCHVDFTQGKAEGLLIS